MSLCSRVQEPQLLSYAVTITKAQVPTLQQENPSNEKPIHHNQRKTPSHCNWRKRSRSKEDLAQPKVNKIKKQTNKTKNQWQITKKAGKTSECHLFPLKKICKLKNHLSQPLPLWGLNYFLDEWCGKKTGRLRETWHFIKPTAASAHCWPSASWATSSLMFDRCQFDWKINTSQYYISVQLLLFIWAFIQ